MIRRLARALTKIRPHYSVIVVGSGYGGGVAASRLARAGQSVCVLERGKELHPGEYPDTPLEAALELQVSHTPNGRLGSPSALFDLHLGDDLSAFVGCGSGRDVADQRERGDSPRSARVRRQLARGAARRDRSRTARRLRRTSRGDAATRAVPRAGAGEAAILATLGRGDGSRRSSVATADLRELRGRHEPRRCGAARVQQLRETASVVATTAPRTPSSSTTPADAHNHGAEIFTEVRVHHIDREQNGWRIEFEALDRREAPFDARLQWVTADVVVLSAGSLGSTEILLRAPAPHPVEPSRRAVLGQRWGDRARHRGRGAGPAAWESARRIRGSAIGSRRVRVSLV